MIDTFKSFIADANKVLITTHKSPDGDAIGSAVACYHFMKAQGKSVLVLLPDLPASNVMSFLDGVEYCDYSSFNEDLAAFELTFCLDYNHEYRVGEEMSQIFEQLNCKKIMIDHHPDPSEFCELTISRPEVCSTAQLFYEVLEEVGMTQALNLQACRALYLGIMTDTGSFRYPSVNAKTHLVLGELISKGVTSHEIHELFYDQNSSDQIQLRGFAVSDKLVVLEGKPIGIISLTLDELNRFNYKKGDTEGLVNVILSIKGISIAVFMMENKEGKVKMSFRSKGKYYVNEFAKNYFNGGGHKYAAGGISEASMEETKKKFISHCNEIL
jgi:bifunctional oligoribonuclease and PAP phosphatase NrnA